MKAAAGWLKSARIVGISSLAPCGKYYQMGTSCKSAVNAKRTRIYIGTTCMKIFILEDDEQRIDLLLVMLAGHELTVARSCTDVAKFQPPYDLLLLDYDLGGRQMVEHPDCGLTFVRLIKDKLKGRSMGAIVHSYNPDGARSMVRELLEVGVFVVAAPFMGPEFLKLLETVEQNARVGKEPIE